MAGVAMTSDALSNECAGQSKRKGIIQRADAVMEDLREV